jgi:methane/ammonia monooxygenase subunit B
MVEAGMEDELVTPQDRNISKVLLVAVPIIVLTANQITANQYPNTIPLQTGIDQILPLPAQVNTEAVVIDTVKAELNVSNRSLKMRVKISNNTDKPLEIGEFTTANIRFINPNKSDQGYNLDRPLVAPEGLRLSDDISIQPGETRELTLTAQDALWESQSLLGLINDADSHIGGLLFLYDSDGKRYITSIAAATVPIFN